MMNAADASKSSAPKHVNGEPGMQKDKAIKSLLKSILNGNNDENDDDDDDSEWEYEYDENETQDFYVTLDLTSYSGQAKRAQGSSNVSSSNAGPSQKTDEAAEKPADDDEDVLIDPAIASEGRSDAEAAPPSKEKDNSVKKEKPIRFQNLHADNPLVVYKNKLFSCNWASAMGTDLFITAAAAEGDEDSDRKDNLLYKGEEFAVLGTTPVRLVGRAAHVQALDPGGNHKQAASSATPEPPRVTGTTGKEFDNVYKRRQAEFLTRFAALKGARGEPDTLPWWTNQPVNKRSSRSTKRASRQKRRQRSLHFEEEGGQEEGLLHRGEDRTIKRRKSSKWNEDDEKVIDHFRFNSQDGVGASSYGDAGNESSDTSGGLDTYWDDPNELEEEEHDDERVDPVRTARGKRRSRDGSAGALQTRSSREAGSERVANGGRGSYAKKRGRPLLMSLSLTGPSEETSRKIGNAHTPSSATRGRAKDRSLSTRQQSAPARGRRRPGRPRGPGKDKMPGRADTHATTAVAAAEAATSLVEGDTEQNKAADRESENAGVNTGAAVDAKEQQDADAVLTTSPSQLHTHLSPPAALLSSNDAVHVGQQAERHAEDATQRRDDGAVEKEDEEGVGMVTRRKSRLARAR